jgi:tRNA-uridine 2-sulfurtransferase
MDPSSVVVALSGGGDSALAAALLQKQGWNVTGLHFLLPASPSKRKARTISVQRVRDRLKIPVFFMDLREDFSRDVVEPFTEAYLTGLTPNPCVVCNERVKFERLVRFAGQEGIRHVATGHYAKVQTGEGEVAELWRGRDRGKEQSYFLHRLNQTQLTRTVLPLGNMTKEEARALSKKMGLPTSSEPESQEICFLPENDYRLFLEEAKGENLRRQGDIITRDGEKVGEHSGTYRYTIGQRHGLGIASPSPYYVAEIRPESNEVVVARKAGLYSAIVKAKDFHWIDGKPLQGPLRVQAQVRYRHVAAPGRLDVISAEEVAFEFDEPQWAITPGQALVCYDGDRVIGGGWISKEGCMAQGARSTEPGRRAEY